MRLIQKPNDQSGGIAALPVSVVYSSRTCFGRAEEDEEVELVVAQQQRVRAVVGRPHVEGGGGRGVDEHAVAAAAQEERDRLVHALGLHAVRVVRPQDDLLPALVEAGERLAGAEELLARPTARRRRRRSASSRSCAARTRRAARARGSPRSPRCAGCASGAAPRRRGTPRARASRGRSPSRRRSCSGIPLRPGSMAQDASRPGSRTSMSDSPSGPTRGPVRRRSLTVRGVTSWISNGSAGFVAYSLSGKTTPSNGRRTASMLLKAIRG